MKLLSRNRDKPKTAAAAAGRESTPYTDAQQVWAERYGSYIAQAYNWRLLALLEAVGLIAAIVGLVYIATQTKFVPYVVAIDKVGAAFAVYPAEKASSIDQRVVHAELGRFIVYARTVTADRALQKISLDRAYDYIAPSSPAYTFVSEYYPAHTPFDIAKEHTVEVHVDNVLPISPTTYEVQWTETLRDVIGAHMKDETWEATVGVSFRPPADEASMLRNPIGLYVNTLTWEKK